MIPFTKSCVLIFFVLPFLAQANPLKDKDKTSFPHKAVQTKNLNILQRDTSYYTTPVLENLDLVYSEDFKSFIPILSDYIKQIDLKLSAVFEKKPYFRKNSIIFRSPYVQIPNASARIYPLPYVLMYPSSGAYSMDQRSIFYWSQDVLIHEMTHIYQYSQNLKWDRKLWWMFNPLIFHRNSLLNSFFMEGGAVLNESIYGFGGRLFSGWARAFVFSQLKQGFSLKRILKPYNDHFSDIEKYLHGGYFFAHLHSQYGMEGISRFFSESSRFIPLDFHGLDQALKRTFGKDLKVLFKDYQNHYAPLAEKQKSSIEKVLFKSSIQLPMNSDKNKIYFLISDMKSPPYLILLDKKTKKIRKRKKNLPLGKIFYKNGRYYSSTFGQTENVSVEYSLFTENFKPVKKYNSQHIMDFYKNKYIALDTRQNHVQNSLLVNNVFYDTSHSSAVMDHKGRIYYFKQNKETRTLYRDKEPLFSFKSYYSYPVEADQDGLYFIGATKYGSSLFIYKESSGVSRLSLSDTISYAKKIKGNEFIVSEIAPAHHEYKIIQTQEIPEQPFLYTYSFEKENPFEETKEILKISSLKDEQQNKIVPFEDKDKQQDVQSLSKNSQESDSLNLKKSIEEKEENTETQDPFEQGKKFFSKESSLNSTQSHKIYNPLNNLTFQHMFFLIWKNPFSKSFFSGPFQFTNRLVFLDPLQFNKFSLTASSVNPKQFSFHLSYSYLKYRPSLSFSFIYNQDFFHKQNIHIFKKLGFLEKRDIPTKKSHIPYRDRVFDMALSYPLIVKNQWRLLLINNFQLGQIQFNNTGKYVSRYLPLLSYDSKPWQNYIGHGGELSYSFERRYPYSYSFHKKRTLRLSYNMIHTKKRRKFKTHLYGQIRTYFIEEIGKEWFVTLNGLAKKSLGNSRPQVLFLEEDIFLSQTLYSNFKRNAQDLYRFDLQILKVLNHSFYPSKIPWALMRLAPLTGLSFLSAKETNKKYDNFLIPFLGIESESNALHDKIIFKTGLAGGYIFNLSNKKKRLGYEFRAWLKGFF